MVSLGFNSINIPWFIVAKHSLISLWICIELFIALYLDTLDMQVGFLFGLKEISSWNGNSQSLSILILLICELNFCLRLNKYLHEMVILNLSLSWYSWYVSYISLKTRGVVLNGCELLPEREECGLKVNPSKTTN